MVYLDDVIIFSKSEEEHAEHLRKVLKSFEAAGLTIKESKCDFAKSSLDLLGFVISERGISAQPDKTAAIANLAPPTDVTELRRFLGMTGYYRTLVAGYAEIVTPLTSLLKKATVW